MLRTITNNFAILTVIGVALAWFQPHLFTWMTNGSIQIAGQPLLSVALGLIMLAMGLEQGLAVGLILVASCPGGTASNIVTFLARGNVALSVAMTMVSTLAAVALTPLLTGELAGTYVEIDRWNLLRNMLAIVLVPVVLGTLLNQLFPRGSARSCRLSRSCWSS